MVLASNRTADSTLDELFFKNIYYLAPEKGTKHPNACNELATHPGDVREANSEEKVDKPSATRESQIL